LALTKPMHIISYMLLLVNKCNALSAKFSQNKFAKYGKIILAIILAGMYKHMDHINFFNNVF